MKVNVRRASRYEQAALEEAKKIKLIGTEEQSIHAPLMRMEDDSAALLSHVDELARQNNDKLTKALGLVEAAYAIRQQIGEANMYHGMAALITRQAELKATNDLLDTILRGLGVGGADAETALSIAAHRRTSPTQRLYGESNDEVTIKVPQSLIREDIEVRLHKIKSERLAVADQLTEKNIATQIEIDEVFVMRLREARIID